MGSTQMPRCHPVQNRVAQDLLYLATMKRLILLIAAAIAFPLTAHAAAESPYRMLRTELAEAKARTRFFERQTKKADKLVAILKTRPGTVVGHASLVRYLNERWPKNERTQIHPVGIFLEKNGDITKSAPNGKTRPINGRDLAEQGLVTKRDFEDHLRTFAAGTAQVEAAVNATARRNGLGPRRRAARPGPPLTAQRLEAFLKEPIAR
jgi:hypothetical protein